MAAFFTERGLTFQKITKMNQQLSAREIAALKSHWQFAVSEDLPPNVTFEIWSRSFTYNTLFDAISVTGEKAARTALDLEQLARFCSGTARRMREAANGIRSV